MTLSEYSIKIYQPKYKSAWNAFVAESKNATFLFQREFMDYHHHRFDDFSLLIYKTEKLVGLLAANRVGDALYSHQGLSYGGLLLAPEVKFKTVLKCMASLLKFLHEQQVKSVYIKEIPTCYHQLPTEEMRYLSFVLKAQLQKRDVLSVIDNQHPLCYSKSREEGIKRAKTQNISVNNDDDFETFWESILIPNLKQKHQTAPVHNLAEIVHLKKHFPKQIKHYNAYHKGKLVAGATIFETPLVAHCQYISGNADKNVLGSLDYLHEHLIRKVYADKRYFDFGASTINDGQQINSGLQFWKEGFGARTLTQDFYTIETKNFTLLDSLLS